MAKKIKATYLAKEAVLALKCHGLTDEQYRAACDKGYRFTTYGLMGRNAWVKVIRVHKGTANTPATFDDVEKAIGL